MSKAPEAAWLLGQWTSGLSLAIASMMGDSPAIQPPGEMQPAPTEGGLLWWEQAFNDAEARFWIGASPQVWRGIGNAVLKSAGIDDADDDNIRSTYLEILSQSLSTVVQALTARRRQEVLCQGGTESAAPEAGCTPVAIDLGGGELTIFAAANEALLALADPTAEAPKPGKASPKPSGPAADAAESRGYPKGLDLLLDVELPVSVSFGRAELPIKDVIKLTTGSIVELNRSIQEPVEVIVNNVVIARGEVVVIEGNFGVRIKQVISRQERIRTLK